MESRGGAASSVQDPPRLLFPPMENRHYDVSTELTLSSNPGQIEKDLTMSDVNAHLNRLILGIPLVEKHILRYPPKNGNNSTESEGIIVDVWDQDTRTSHELHFKRWASSSGSYVLIGGWHEEFVLRRQLRERDKIGLTWDPYNSKFYFCVLSRAAAPPQNPN